jgi:guanylate kinase
MAEQRMGVALIISAPSGTGKSTLVRMLRAEFPEFAYSVSYTTREPRKGEVDGREYHFVSRDRFLALLSEKFFAEYAEVHDNLYGTPLQATLETLSRGQDLLFDVDVQGAYQLKHSLDLGSFVFLFPPSFDELRHRLTARGSEDERTMALRMDNAREEIGKAPFFEYWVVNEVLDNAYAALRSIYLAEQVRARTRPGLMEQVLATWTG